MKFRSAICLSILFLVNFCQTVQAYITSYHARPMRSSPFGPPRANRANRQISATPPSMGMPLGPIASVTLRKAASLAFNSSKRTQPMGRPPLGPSIGPPVGGGAPLAGAGVAGLPALQLPLLVVGGLLAGRQLARSATALRFSRADGAGADAPAAHGNTLFQSGTVGRQLAARGLEARATRGLAAAAVARGRRRRGSALAAFGEEEEEGGAYGGEGEGAWEQDGLLEEVTLENFEVDMSGADFGAAGDAEEGEEEAAAAGDSSALEAGGGGGEDGEEEENVDLDDYADDDGEEDGDSDVPSEDELDRDAVAARLNSLFGGPPPGAGAAGPVQDAVLADSDAAAEEAGGEDADELQKLFGAAGRDFAAEERAAAAAAAAARAKEEAEEEGATELVDPPRGATMREAMGRYDRARFRRESGREGEVDRGFYKSLRQRWAEEDARRAAAGGGDDGLGKTLQALSISYEGPWEPASPAAKELGLRFARLDLAALAVEDNYPYVKLETLPEDLRAAVAAAPTELRAAALYHVFLNAAGKFASRPAAWALRAACGALFPEEDLAAPDGTARRAFVHALTEGAKQAGRGMPALDAATWKAGCWAHFLCARHVPQWDRLGAGQLQVEQAVLTYFDIHDSFARKKYTAFVQEQYLKNQLTDLFRPGLGHGMPYEEFRGVVPRMVASLQFLTEELGEMDQERFAFWLDAESRRLLKDLLDRAYQQANTGEMGKAVGERLSAWQLLDVAVDIGTALLQIYWRQDYPDYDLDDPLAADPPANVWLEKARDRLIACSPMNRKTTFYAGYARYWLQQVLRGDRPARGLRQFDLQVLCHMMNGNPIVARKKAARVWPEALAQTVTRARDRSLLDARRVAEAEAACELSGEKAREGKDLALRLVVRVLTARGDPQLDASAAWASNYLGLDGGLRARLVGAAAGGAAGAEVGQDVSVLDRLRDEDFARQVGKILGTPIADGGGYGPAAKAIDERLAAAYGAALERREPGAVKAAGAVLMEAFSGKLKSLLQQISDAYSSQDQAKGGVLIQQTSSFVNEVAVPFMQKLEVADTFEDLASMISVNENEEYNISELCWDLVDSGYKDKQAVELVQKAIGLK